MHIEIVASSHVSNMNIPIKTIHSKRFVCMPCGGMFSHQYALFPALAFVVVIARHNEAAEQD